jgi:hypothetical protein
MRRRGYQMNLAPIAARELERTTEKCHNWILLRLVSTLDLAPLQGASLRVVGSQG